MEVYRRELPALLATSENLGRYVLIGGDPAVVVGVFATNDEAVTAGYEKFGLSASFLARRIAEEQQPTFFARNIRSCPT